MFLRRHRRTFDGETYDYWTLVRTVRTASGPRQQVVASLGKEPGMERQSRRGWEQIAAMLEGRECSVQGKLGKALPASPPAQWTQVDVQGVRVERVRDFGQVYLALSLWRRLHLHTLLHELIKPGREEVPWEEVACILTVARFCGNQSELEVAERWYADSALEDLLGIPFARINDARLYRGLDVLLAHKDKLCAHLMERYETMFGVGFEFLLYDVTSTYFEGQAMQNEKAARGYSRDQRPDCKQVNIGLVVTPEGGLPVAYEVFAGNRTDVTTVEEMIAMMEAKYGKAKRIWVMDRGMVSEENLDFLRERGARYLVGTPKGQLKQFEAKLLDQSDWSEVQPGVEVKLVDHPDGQGREQYVLCRSADRQKKEAAMLELKRQRLMAKLRQTDASLRKTPAKDPGTVERRIGRWLGRYPAAERLVTVRIERNAEGRAAGLKITERSENAAWAQHAHGAYLLRTNCPERDPAKLWRWYMQLTQAEDAFRVSKTDLHLRPVFHQKTHRVEAHILVCFLSLAMWRTLEMWMHGKDLGNCARQLIKEIGTVRSMDVVLPVREAVSKRTADVRLRVVARPDREVAILLQRLGLEMPSLPKRIQNVVEKTAS
jgi:transposase